MSDAREAFGMADEQPPALFQAIMEPADDKLLHFPVKVNHDVPAEDDVPVPHE